MGKYLTEQQIKDAANKHGYTYAQVKAVLEVESRGTGFNADGTPKILFERHKFWKLLGDIRWFTMRLKIMAKHPRICNPRAGGYGKYSEQNHKLAIAASYNRDAALQSCSWGLGQVMGYHWQELGYKSLQSFINAMYESEADQLEAMLRYVDRFGLKDELQKNQWAAFARGYNGVAYRKNRYDEKLAAAHRKFAA